MEKFERFTVLIAKISRSIKKIKAEEMAKWNLKSNHVPCIYYLYLRGPLTPKKLSDISTEDKANLSRAIDFLESEDYIRQIIKQNKRYKIQYELTEKGISVGRALDEKIKSLLKNISKKFSDAEGDIMYKCLGAIDESLALVTSEYK